MLRRRGAMSKDNELDQRILEILRMDSRKSFVDIGKELGLSESAIRRRIKNLIDDGSISRFTIEENARKNQRHNITLRKLYLRHKLSSF